MASFRTAPRAIRSLAEVTKTQNIARRALTTEAATQHARALPASRTISRPSVTTTATRHIARPAVLQQRHQSTNATPAPVFYTDEAPGKTALHDLHLAHGGKMVPFGGYSMPLQYADHSITLSHHHTREHASLFDVGHMTQYHISGPGAESFLETLTPAALSTLAPGQSTLSALLHPTTGGIVDDCIITRLSAGPDHLFYLVLNAGNRAKDYAYLSTALDTWDGSINPVTHIRHLEASGNPFGLLALQGPAAASILSSVLAPSCKVDVSTWYFGSAKHITLALPSGESAPVVASRGGYTGEDGFELSVPPQHTAEVAETLLKTAGPDVLRLAGLGARDSLRLEAGMCLYGHDIDDATTPAEAGLGWIVPKSRREGPARGGFNGAETILPQLVLKSKGGVGVERRRVGIVVDGAPAREGAVIKSLASEGGEGGEVIGKVTSGCPSPTLGVNVAMGYVRDGLHKAGTEVQVLVRGKPRRGVVTKMPFVPSKYYKER